MSVAIIISSIYTITLSSLIKGYVYVKHKQGVSGIRRDFHRNQTVIECIQIDRPVWRMKNTWYVPDELLSDGIRPSGPVK